MVLSLRFVRSVQSISSTMAVELTDLPNEMLTKIIQALGAVRQGFGNRRDSKPLAALCRVSRRFCILVRPELYRVCNIGDAYDLAQYFESSGIRQVPNGTLVAVRVSPQGGYDFTCLEEELMEGTARLANLKQAVSGVKYVVVDLTRENYELCDNNPNYYLPFFKAFDPKFLLYDSSFMPVEMKCDGPGKPALEFSILMKTISSFTRLTKLQMPYVVFDKVTETELEVLRRLPLEVVIFDWPSAITPAKLCAILMALPFLQDKGLVISYQDDAGDDLAATDFRESFGDFTQASLEDWLEEQGKEDLLDKVCWQILVAGPKANCEMYNPRGAISEESALVGA